MTMNNNHSHAENGSYHEHKLNTPLLEIFITIDIIFLIFCIIGNVIVIFVILKNEILNSPSFMFIISVAAAHLFVGLCVLPMFIVSHFPEDHMTSLMCKLMMYVTKVSTTASTLSLLPMTFDNFHRYDPRSQTKLITFKQAYIEIGFVWVVALLYAIWMPFLHDMVKEIHHDTDKWISIKMCEVKQTKNDEFKLYIMVDFFSMYVVPLLTMIVLYLMIFWWIWWGHMRTADKLDMRIRRMTTCSGIILVLSYALCGFGNYGMLFRIYWGLGYFPEAFLLRDVFSLLSFSLSWINVVLLFGFNPTFREVIFEKSSSTRNNSIESEEVGSELQTRVKKSRSVSPINDIPAVSVQGTNNGKDNREDEV